jgi:hypothetical protein
MSYSKRSVLLVNCLRFKVQDLKLGSIEGMRNLSPNSSGRGLSTVDGGPLSHFHICCTIDNGPSTLPWPADS